MRIQRSHSRLTFRRRSRWTGCFPFLAVMSLIVAAGVVGRARISDYLWQILQPPPTRATLRDAQNAFAHGDFARAQEYALEIYEQNSRESAALALLARVLIYDSYSEINQDQQRRRALTLTTRALEHDPANVVLLGIHGFTQQANEQSVFASRTALRAIHFQNENVPARITLSMAYGDQGLFAAALREAQRAVELATAQQSDWLVDAYRALASAHADLGQYQDAIDAINRAIQHNNRLLPLFFERALYAMQIGDADTATASYFNVIALDQDNIKARFRLCELSSTLREGVAAINYCRDVTERARGWVDGWHRLGREYFLQGNFREARLALGRCSSLQVAQGVPPEERYFECWYLQGQAAEVIGDCTTLMNIYEEFQQMATSANLPQTWTYPPGGPPICAPEATLPAG